MSLPVEVLRLHLDYTAWANSRLVKAASELTLDELTRDFGTSDKSVLGTLTHTFAADRLWLTRVKGKSPAAFVSDRDYALAILQSEWPAVMQEWKRWGEQLTGDSAIQPLPYMDLKGLPFFQPAWMIVLHVVNHGTHHRGQVSGFLRILGKTPPPLDLIAFYRQHQG